MGLCTLAVRECVLVGVLGMEIDKKGNKLEGFGEEVEMAARGFQVRFFRGEVRETESDLQGLLLQVEEVAPGELEEVMMCMNGQAKLSMVKAYWGLFRWRGTNNGFGWSSRSMRDCQGLSWWGLSLSTGRRSCIEALVQCW